MPRIDYVFKPANKYPSRIYLYLNASEWNERNKRPHGTQKQRAFLSRPMTEEEEQRCKQSWRMIYIQYDSWDGLIEDEISTVGNGEFIEKLKSFRSQFKIGTNEK